VVDDHQPVRELVRAFLEAAGFETVIVPTAAEALKTLREPVDLVISDLYMPGMDGLSLYREVVARHPSLHRRFLLMTGGLVTEAVQEFLGEQKGALLRKPFSRQQLLDAVRAVLGGSNGSR
jgi:DNA-binding response OmpR family regulator